MRADKIAKAFGRALKRHRNTAKLSQMDLAEMADLHRTYISLLEVGGRQPSLATLLALAKAMKISSLALLKDTLEELGQSK